MKTKELAGAVLVAAFFHVAGAAEIKVLSAGALEPGMKAAAAEFQKSSGHSVNLAFNRTARCPAAFRRRSLRFSSR